LKIASILDTISFNCFKYEGDFFRLDSLTWEERLENEKPDMLFIESAWNEDFKKIFRKNPDRGTPSGDPVCWCKQHDIPTVFWNKEDPYHFDHFIDIAKDFDYIFTTDVDCIPRYQSVTGHNRVYLLPFAAQTQIHNPINKDLDKLGNVAFAGTWYNLRPERQKDMDLLLMPALKYGLHIYDRMNNFTLNRNYVFPEHYQPYIKGYLPYEEMIHYYKKYPVFLNVNTVKTSPTMISRRVMELLACGTNVISNQSASVDNLFPGLVLSAKSEEDTEKYLNGLLKDKELRDRLSLLGQRAVFNKHTYRQRYQTILSKVGFDEKNELPGVTVIAVTNSPDTLPPILLNFKNQSYANMELIVIINNDLTNQEKWNAVMMTDKRIRAFRIAEKSTNGTCYNFAISQAKYEFIAFFENNDIYTPNYIEDMMHAFEYADAGIVGKCSHYVYLRDRGMLNVKNPDMEYRYVESFPTSAVVAKKEIFDTVQFDAAVKFPFPLLFGACIQKGIRLYASDRFNFVSVWHSDVEDRPWKKGSKLSPCGSFSNVGNCLAYITV